MNKEYNRLVRAANAVNVASIEKRVANDAANAANRAHTHAWMRETEAQLEYARALDAIGTAAGLEVVS